jgi:hypothetical protein
VSTASASVRLGDVVWSGENGSFHYLGVRMTMRHVAMVMLADRKAMSFAAGHLVGMAVGIVLSVAVPHEVATVLGVDGTVHASALSRAARASRRGL